ncbi:MAG: hypothetical protein KAT71_08305 [Gammaproteobacteria bacterium]|nr:hypothetical protein [Gammaproteobacteria bacterium]
MEGIKELKELVVFIAALASAADKAGQDGFGVEDMALFMAPIMKAPDAFQGLIKAKAELADLDQAEIDELNVAFAAELDLEDKDLEGMVEKALTIIAEINSIVLKVKAMKAV